jgi:hypothetical protein
MPAEQRLALARAGLVEVEAAAVALEQIVGRALQDLPMSPIVLDRSGTPQALAAARIARAALRRALGA